MYSSERQGMCVRPQQCADETLLYWPPDGRCYYRLSQGPCYPGSLLDIGSDGLANCTVSISLVRSMTCVFVINIDYRMTQIFDGNWVGLMVS